ncbi:MAG: radical SAM protein [Elusimicrobiales bacterium]|nr:radical SAM protein [Elusimicrobiales bacterium]
MNNCDSCAERVCQTPPHRVFFNWDIIHSCNYRCAYCPFTVKGWEHYPKPEVVPPLADLVRAWERMRALYGACHLMISGGEPSSYPHFAELIAAISKWHTLEIITNLSFDPDSIAGLVPPTGIRFASSFHPQFTSAEDFLARARRLKDAGMEVFTNFVAYPPLLKDAARYKSMFQEKDISFFVLPFMGTYDGRVFPRDYSEAERREYEAALGGDGAETKVSRDLLNWRTGDNAPVVVPGHSGPVQPAAGAEKPAPPPARDVVCRMGQMYAKIYPDGKTQRCCGFVGDTLPEGHHASLGNIFKDPDFRLHAEPVRCTKTPCPCERCMVIGGEAKWESRWKINLTPP